MSIEIPDTLLIEQDSLIKKPIHIGKGEILYFQSRIVGKHIFGRLIAGDIKQNGSRKNIRESTSIIDVRRSVAHISDEIYLWNDLSVHENLMNYMASIERSGYDNSASDILKNFRVDLNQKVSSLSVEQKHILNIAIGLGKDPDLILYDDPMSQFDINFYCAIMDRFYTQVVKKGVTLLSTVLIPELQSKFPGRIIP